MKLDDSRIGQEAEAEVRESVPDLAREAQRTASGTPERPNRPGGGGEVVDWHDVALRLKAEMDNYRKRQKRWAEDEVLREKERFLRQFLGVLDNLEQALHHIDPADPAHQGVQMAYDGMLSLLLREGVERVFAKGRPFDPTRHEAVGIVPAEVGGVGDMHVAEVTAPGYLLIEPNSGTRRVLRPAKVVVAKQDA